MYHPQIEYLKAMLHNPEIVSSNNEAIVLPLDPTIHVKSFNPEKSSVFAVSLLNLTQVYLCRSFEIHLMKAEMKVSLTGISITSANDVPKDKLVSDL